MYSSKSEVNSANVQKMPLKMEAKLTVQLKKIAKMMKMTIGPIVMTKEKNRPKIQKINKKRAKKKKVKPNLTK